MHLVPECSNLSVGYYNEHHPHEALDVAHLIELRDHMVKFDQSKLVIERNPFAPVKPAKKLKLKALTAPAFGSRRHRREDNLRDLVYWHPEKVAAFLENEGVTYDQGLSFTIWVPVNELEGRGIVNVFDEGDGPITNFIKAKEST